MNREELIRKLNSVGKSVFVEYFEDFRTLSREDCIRKLVCNDVSNENGAAIRYGNAKLIFEECMELDALQLVLEAKRVPISVRSCASKLINAYSGKVKSCQSFKGENMSADLPMEQFLEVSDFVRNHKLGQNFSGEFNTCISILENKLSDTDIEYTKQENEPFTTYMFLINTENAGALDVGIHFMENEVRIICQILRNNRCKPTIEILTTLNDLNDRCMLTRFTVSQGVLIATHDFKFSDYFLPDLVVMTMFRLVQNIDNYYDDIMRSIYAS